MTMDLYYTYMCFAMILNQILWLVCAGIAHDRHLWAPGLWRWHCPGHLQFESFQLTTNYLQSLELQHRSTQFASIYKESLLLKTSPCTIREGRTSIHWYVLACTSVYHYVLNPESLTSTIYTSIYQYILECTGTYLTLTSSYLYVRVCIRTSTYFTLISTCTCTYQYVPLCTGAH